MSLLQFQIMQLFFFNERNFDKVTSEKKTFFFKEYTIKGPHKLGGLSFIQNQFYKSRRVMPQIKIFRDWIHHIDHSRNPIEFPVRIFGEVLSSISLLLKSQYVVLWKQHLLLSYKLILLTNSTIWCLAKPFVLLNSGLERCTLNCCCWNIVKIFMLKAPNGVFCILLRIPPESMNQRLHIVTVFVEERTST